MSRIDTGNVSYDNSPIHEQKKKKPKFTNVSRNQR